MEKYDDENLALRIRAVMDERGITITEAAEATGVPYRTLQNQLGGKNKMPASTFAKLTEMREVPISFLVNERIRLNARALQLAIRDAMGDMMPSVDDEMRVKQADPSRSDAEYEQQSKALAYIIRDRYEQRVISELGLTLSNR